MPEPLCTLWIINNIYEIIFWKALSTSPITLAAASTLVFFFVIFFSLTSLCHSNGHIETMPDI